MTRLPPTIHELLQVEEFRRMMKTRPYLPPSLQWGSPWRLWAKLDDGRWLTKEYDDYADVWRKAVDLTRKDQVDDVCIVNKRMLVLPPKGMVRAMDLAGYGGTWCPRCRRPSYFGAFKSQHHALKLQPALTPDDPFRCYYCGIRRAMVRDSVLAAFR